MYHTGTTKFAISSLIAGKILHSPGARLAWTSVKRLSMVVTAAEAWVIVVPAPRCSGICVILVFWSYSIGTMIVWASCPGGKATPCLVNCTYKTRYQLHDLSIRTFCENSRPSWFFTCPCVPVLWPHRSAILHSMKREHPERINVLINPWNGKQYGRPMRSLPGISPWDSPSKP